MFSRILFSLVLLLFLLPLHAQWEVKHQAEERRPIFVIKFYDEQNGFAMGDRGLVLKTEDGGESWTELENEIEGFILDFAYSDENTVHAALWDTNAPSNQKKKIYRSVDGGLNWTLEYQSTGEMYQIHFIDSQNGLACGTYAIHRSSNGGDSWSVAWDMTENNYAYGDIRSFEMLNDSVGLAAGRGYNEVSEVFESFLLKTTDGGLTWEIFGTLNSDIQALDFLNEEVGYISDDYFTLKTEDGGMTWDTLDNVYGTVEFSTPSDSVVWTVNHPNLYSEYDVITEFAISKSLDAGDTWDGEYRNGAHMNSVFFFTDSVGFVAGDYAIILKTENCGGEIIGDYPWELFSSLDNISELPLQQLYPNPVLNRLFIKDLQNPAAWTFSIVSPSGSIIKTGQLTQSGVDTADLPQGLYFILLNDKEEARLGKFIKSN